MIRGRYSKGVLHMNNQWGGGGGGGGGVGVCAPESFWGSRTWRHTDKLPINTEALNWVGGRVGGVNGVE